MANSESSTLIGSRIRSRRKALGLKQEELAQAVGVGQSSIAQYEGGTREINASDLEKYSEALRVPISYFFGDFNPYDLTLHIVRAEDWMSDAVRERVPPADKARIRGKAGAVSRSTMSVDADEEQLLGYYRRLSPIMKRSAISVLSTLSEGQPQSDEDAVREI